MVGVRRRSTASLQYARRWDAFFERFCLPAMVIHEKEDEMQMRGNSGYKKQHELKLKSIA